MEKLFQFMWTVSSFPQCMTSILHLELCWNDKEKFIRSEWNFWTESVLGHENSNQVRPGIRTIALHCIAYMAYLNHWVSIWLPKVAQTSQFCWVNQKKFVGAGFFKIKVPLGYILCRNSQRNQQYPEILLPAQYIWFFKGMASVCIKGCPRQGQG